MLFTDIATVYNHYTDANGNDSWQRSVVNGVQWRHQRILTAPNGTTLQREKAESLTFDFSHEYARGVYLPPKEWEALENKAGYWTLNDESGLDVIVYGVCTKEITASYKLINLHTDNDFVGTINEVADNRNRTFLKNIKVILQ